jgi:hypothetical protein
MSRNLIRSSLFGAVSLIALSSQAHAACGLDSSGKLVCVSTTTTDTTAPANAPDDRNYTFATGVFTPFSAVVTSGSTIDGFGLAFTDIGTGINSATITNDGAITVDLGDPMAPNAPTQGGTAALNLTTNNAQLIYNGNGTVTNNGAGDGVDILQKSGGTGSVTYSNTGAVFSLNGNGISISGNSTSGDITATVGVIDAKSAGSDGLAATTNSTTANINLTATDEIDAGRIGINAVINNNVGTGNVTVTTDSAATINVVANGVGIQAATTGTGDVTVTADGAITSGGVGIDTHSVAGTTKIVANGDINAVNNAILAAVVGSGNIDISGSGALTSSGGAAVSAQIIPNAGSITVNLTGDVSGTTGIKATTQGGANMITAGDVTGNNGDAITASSTGGAITVMTNGAVSAKGVINSIGADGIKAVSDTGTVMVTANGAIDAMDGTGIDARSRLNTGAGSVSVTENGGITAVNGIIAQAGGTGDVTVKADGDINVGIQGISAQTFQGGKVDVSGSGAVTADTGTAVLAIAQSGTGSVMVDLTGVIKGATGIQAQSADGVVTVTTGDVTGTNGDAISAQSAGDVTILTNGTVTSSRTVVSTAPLPSGIVATSSVGNVKITAIGAVDAAGDAIHATTTNGGGVTVVANGDVNAGNRAIFAESQLGGNVSVSGSGTIMSTGTGGAAVVAQSLTGPATVMVNLTGPVTGGAGIITNSDSGATTITTGDVTGTNGFGIDAGSSTGAITITTNGALTGTGDDAIVAGSGDFTHTGGAINITTNGTVTTTATTANAGLTGIFAASTGAEVTVTANGAINTDGAGIIAASAVKDVTVTTATAATINSGAGIEAGTEGTGNIKVTTNGGVDAADVGILARALGSGAVSVTTNGIVTADFTGIHAVSTTGAVTVVANGAITAGGDGAGIQADSDTGDVSVTANGAITADGAATTGIAAETGGTGTATIVANGAVHSKLIAAFAQTAGGNVSITGAGALTSTASLAVEGNVSAGTGTVTINLAGPVSGSNGIFAGSASGAIDITAGDVTGMSDFAIAAASNTGAITIAANGNVSGALEGIFAQSGGAKSITVAANKSVTSPRFAIELLGAGFNTILNHGTIGAAGSTAVQSIDAATAITNTVGATLSGLVNLSGAADTLDNSGTFNASGISDFGAGVDLLTNRSGGIVNLAAASGFSGLEMFNNAGRVNITGPASLTGGTFNNLAGGTVTAANGARLDNLIAFNNAGAINLVGNTNADRLTIGGNYTGTGGATLAIDVTRDVVNSDRLIVNGSTSGKTLVQLNLLPGSGVINATGSLIVDGASVGTANAFVLAPTPVTGLVDYSIAQRGADYFLLASAAPSLGELAGLGLEGLDLWYQSFDIARDGIFNRNAAAKEGHKLSIWGQAYANRDKYGSRHVSDTVLGSPITYSGRIHNSAEGVQAGIDYNFGPAVIGVTAGYEHNDADIGQASISKAKGYNFGAYALVGGPAGFYGGLTVKRDNYSLHYANSVRGFALRPDAYSTGVDGEAGYRGSAGNLRFEARTGLSYVSTDVDKFSVDAIDFEVENVKSLRGRIGGRLIVPGLQGAYFDGTLLHEFKGDSSVTASSGGTSDSFGAPGRGTWGRVEAGIGGDGSRVQLSAFATVGDVQGVGIRGGFRF